MKPEFHTIYIGNHLKFFFNNFLVDKIVSALLINGRGSYLRGSIYYIIKSFKLIRLEGYKVLAYTLQRLKQRYSVYVDAVKTKRTPYRIIRIYQYPIKLDRKGEIQKGLRNLKEGLVLRKERSFFTRLKNEFFDSFIGKLTYTKALRRLQTELIWAKFLLKRRYRRRSNTRKNYYKNFKVKAIKKLHVKYRKRHSSMGKDILLGPENICDILHIVSLLKRYQTPKVVLDKLFIKIPIYIHIMVFKPVEYNFQGSLSKLVTDILLIWGNIKKLRVKYYKKYKKINLDYLWLGYLNGKLKSLNVGQNTRKFNYIFQSYYLKVNTNYNNLLLSSSKKNENIY